MHLAGTFATRRCFGTRSFEGFGFTVAGWKTLNITKNRNQARNTRGARLARSGHKPVHTIPNVRARVVVIFLQSHAMIPFGFAALGSTLTRAQKRRSNVSGVVSRVLLSSCFHTRRVIISSFWTGNQLWVFPPKHSSYWKLWSRLETKYNIHLISSVFGAAESPPV